jgi:ribosomal protein S27E
MALELNCQTCGNNRFQFPEADEDPVRCQFCGDTIGTLAAVKQRVIDEVIKGRASG